MRYIVMRRTLENNGDVYIGTYKTKMEAKSTIKERTRMSVFWIPKDFYIARVLDEYMEE